MIWREKGRRCFRRLGGRDYIMVGYDGMCYSVSDGK